MYPIDDLSEPGYFTLQDADRFHCIVHSGEVALPDRTTMILVLFVIRRGKLGLFDMYIVNKFFRVDGTTNKTMMKKEGIPATEIEETISATTTTFALGLKMKGGVDIEWDELDLRQVTTKDEQIKRIRRWGKLTNVKVKRERSQ
jgi:hypothetical protein